VDRLPRNADFSAKLTRRHFLQLSSAGLVIVPGLSTLAACGSGSSTSSSAAAQVPPDKTAILKFGQMRGQSYDPIRMVAVEDVQLNALFDTLASRDPQTGKLEPRLATSWNVLTDRVRFKLRQGVTFQDGTPLDADAVKFSIDRVLSDPASNIKTQLYMVDKVEVVDPQTVDVVLKVPAPQPLLLQMTTRPGMIVSPTAVRAAATSDAFSKKPVGAGMYRIEGDWHPRESMSVRAWPGYWDKNAQLLGGLDFKEIAMNARVNAIRASASDVGGFDGSDVATLRADQNLRVQIGTGRQTRGLNMNLTIEPFTNPKVRQAIAYAIDREAVVKAMTAGFGKPAYQPFTPDSPAYDKSLEGSFKYNPDKARQLLSEAGFANGLTFQSIVGGTAASYVQFGELVQGQLKALNINMDLKLVDQAQAIPMLYRQGPSGHGVAASAPIGGGGNSGTTDFAFRQTFLREGFLNPGGVEVPGVRELLDKAAAAKDEDTAANFYRQANKIVTEGLYALIPIYYDPGIVGYHKYVGGITFGFSDADQTPDLLRGMFISEGKVPVG
jgi:ABC-type transport system substrate-binding protein